MRSNRFLLELLVMALWALPAHGLHAASAGARWVHRSSNVVSNAQDAAYKLVLDLQSNLIVIGSIADSAGSDFLTLKYSALDGALLWQRRYDGPAHDSDRPSSVAVDGNGDVVVTGSSTDERGYPDIYTVKYAAADGALLWERRYNGPANTWDEAHAVAVDARGDVVVTGYSHSETYPDIYTAKYAGADGALLWEKRYNSPNDGWDEARALALDTAGNVVVAGLSTKSDGYQDFYAAKYAAADGALLWEKRYSLQGGHDSVYAVTTDSAGNVAVAGSSGGPPQGFYTAKFAAADGALLWEKRYTGPANEGGVALAVAVDPGGNVVTTGVTWNMRVSDGYTAKYAAADGTLLWERHYNGPANSEDRTHTVAVDVRGNVVVAGYSDRSSSAPGSDYHTAKYAAADGALLWERRYNGPGNWEDQAVAAAVDASGQVFVTGFSYGVQFNPDFYTAKYRAEDGALLWGKPYRGAATSEDRGQAVAIDSKGDVVMAGISSNDYQSDHYAAKYAAASGALLWERRHHDPTHVSDQPRAAAVDARGDVAMAGFSWEDASHYTAKYAATDGALLWQTRVAGLVLANDITMDPGGNVVLVGSSLTQAGFTNRYTAKHAAADGRLLWEKSGDAYFAQDQIVAVAVDASGNVAVTGPSFSTNFNFDYYTAKYAAANGALLWEKRYNGPGGWTDWPTAIAVDAAGNVVVTGSSDSDYHTVKYAAANGALLWERRYNGPGDGTDSAHAVAVASNGDVVVTGSSVGAQFNSDYYTAKYAAATGALLWDRRYNGPANRDDVATSVAVDADGNAVVTGSSDNSNNSDYFTAKYAAANGVLLWEKRYNGPADGDDSPLTSRCLALGPGGSVVVTGTSASRHGAATGYDYATVDYAESATISALPNQGGYQLQFPALPGQQWAVQRTTSLPGSWTTLTLLTAPASGYILYTDSSPPPGGGFYRLASP